MLLPKKDHLTNLITKQSHLAILHSGDYQISRMQEKFWIPQGTVHSK